jgi:hypothetical protein
MAGLDRLDPAIPLGEARPCHMIGIAGSSPAMTAAESISSGYALGRPPTDTAHDPSFARINPERRLLRACGSSLSCCLLGNSWAITRGARRGPRGTPRPTQLIRRRISTGSPFTWRVTARTCSLFTRRFLDCSSAREGDGAEGRQWAQVRSESSIISRPISALLKRIGGHPGGRPGCQRLPSAGAPDGEWLHRYERLGQTDPYSAHRTRCRANISRCPPDSSGVRSRRDR